jgi:predicted transcriptional regulator
VPTPGGEPGARTAAIRLETARLVDAGQAVPEADYRPGFSNTVLLFGELSPARLALLESLESLGPRSIAALAGDLGRSRIDVDADTVKLLDLGLVAQTADGLVSVPWEEIQIRVNLTGAQAA